MKENTKSEILKFVKQIAIIILSFFTLLGVISKFDINNDKILFNGNSYLFLIIMYVMYHYFNNKDKLNNSNNMLKVKDKRITRNTIIVSSIIVFMYMTGYLTSHYFLINIELTSKMFILFVIFKSISLMLWFYTLIKNIYIKITFLANNDNNINFKFFTNNIKSIFTVGAIIFVAYIPYLIDSYPGYLTYDFAIQIRQALKYEGLVNHHPYMHTLLIRCMPKNRKCNKWKL